MHPPFFDKGEIRYIEIEKEESIDHIFRYSKLGQINDEINYEMDMILTKQCN
jgi:hypothetical protein